jgi:hypothetical protein
MEVGRDALARLRRAVGEDGERPEAAFMELVGAAVFDQLTPETALLLDRWMTQVAAAAEQLGPDAELSEIMARARELAARPL